MNPILLWIQAACLIAASAVVGFSPAHVVAVVIGGATLAWAGVLNSSYARALAGRERSHGDDGGPDRTGGDRHVTQTLLAGLAALVFGLVGGAMDAWLWQAQALSVLFSSLAILTFLVYASSLVDWYYVRPRVDGVVREPPCKSSRDPIWHRVTRLWYLHRGVAELLGTAAVLIALTSILAATTEEGDLSSPTIATIAVAGLGALIVQLRRAVHTLRDYAIAPPRFWLGDQLTDEAGRVYYLLHVTVAGIVVREWSPGSEAWEDPIDISHARLEATSYHRSAFDGCECCSKVNPQCEWEVTGRDASVRHSRLVW